ncbi:organic hydroperoxide resistance protein [Volucribacter amazonae]|uniref:Organic hydroperoxide resistance protein n=1 Tax=Volucribacter amazonae TaxID=256731 RepID=A0A9X4SM03_9PAST|nr:organic hydroperoxide resistance protein [Volucribacter amazonae]MDG6895588.1 organic hydroperoxide resistance protein [Volucribacter amazonae]
MKIFYQTQATATGGRTGRTALDDGSLAFDLALPNSGQQGANPEQLFAMGYAACFDSALNLTAQQMKLPLSHSQTSVQIGIGQVLGGAYQLTAKISVTTQGLSQEQAESLVEKAHQVCPYSNAVRGNIEVELVTLAK